MQFLVIFALPFLNDFGAGIVSDTYYKGVATTEITPVSSPTTNAFYYVESEGVYNNFATGLKAYQGDCIEWNGSVWKIGSTYLDSTFADYQSKNNSVLIRLRQQGIDTLCLVPHNSRNQETNRPFTNEIGLPLLRAIAKRYGYAIIDVYRYKNEVLPDTSIWSDGTHLNETGVDMYVGLILAVLTTANTMDEYAYPVVENKALKGTNTGNVSFGFEFSQVPTVIVSNNPSVTVTSVRKDGFDVSGSGEFDWIAKIL